MQIPRFVWNRRHNVASFTVSYSHRLWNTRDGGDLILGYNATGRLARVVVLDADAILPADANLHEGLLCVTDVLVRRRLVDQNDLDVLRSAIDRAAARPATPPVGRYAHP